MLSACNALAPGPRPRHSGNVNPPSAIGGDPRQSRGFTSRKLKILGDGRREEGVKPGFRGPGTGLWCVEWIERIMRLDEWRLKWRDGKNPEERPEKAWRKKPRPVAVNLGKDGRAVGLHPRERCRGTRSGPGHRRGRTRRSHGRHLSCQERPQGGHRGERDCGKSDRRRQRVRGCPDHFRGSH
jgi:hypothetical protein